MKKTFNLFSSFLSISLSVKFFKEEGGGGLIKHRPFLHPLPVFCTLDLCFCTSTCVVAPSICVFAPSTCVFAPSTCVFAPSTCVFAPSTCVFAPYTCVFAPSIGVFSRKQILSGFRP